MLPSSDPFVNASGTTPEDFELTGPLANYSGYDVCLLDACSSTNEYDMDAFAIDRGADGTWDRGAYELGTSTATRPDAPSGLTATVQ